MKVLIVEDEAIAAMALEMELAAFAPKEVLVVSSGEEALELVFAFQPDLIFMDIFLAGKMNGIEVVRKIHEKTKIPIVYATASQSREIEAQMSETFYVGLLMKPYLPGEIAQIMAEFLN